MNRPAVALIGSGNLAWHLGHRLKACGFPIKQVYSRSLDHAQALAIPLQAAAIDQLDLLVPQVDWMIVAVSDDAIALVAQTISQNRTFTGLCTHTSGAAPATLLAPYFTRFGVFYPLQTFSKDRTVDFSTIPICIEASQSHDLELLRKWGTTIGQRVFHLTDKQRAVAHVAAVFANNFPNFLFLIAEKILAEENTSLDLLRPLMLETAQKVQEHDPRSMQTGPARREDLKTIEKHMALLEAHPDYRGIYEILTRAIRQEWAGPE